MAREYVPVFFDWLDVTQDLTAEEKGNLIDAVVAYASGNEYEHLLTGGCKIAFRFMKGQVDRNTTISEQRSKAGSNKKEHQEAKEEKEEQTETKENKPEQTETNFPKENNNNKEKENKKENKKEVLRFAPPTLDEVSEYCKERGNKVDPEKFVDFYASKGWRVGNQPMKDWKAAVRTWEKSSRDEWKSGRGVAFGKTDWTHDYEQRSYEGMDEYFMDSFSKQIEEMEQEQKAGAG